MALTPELADNSDKEEAQAVQFFIYEGDYYELCKKCNQ
jgi:hypothetical protein